jgi:hypothetical protein
LIDRAIAAMTGCVQAGESDHASPASRDAYSMKHALPELGACPPPERVGRPLGMFMTFLSGMGLLASPAGCGVGELGESEQDREEPFEC